MEPGAGRPSGRRSVATLVVLLLLVAACAGGEQVAFETRARTAPVDDAAPTTPTSAAAPTETAGLLPDAPQQGSADDDGAPAPGPAGPATRPSPSPGGGQALSGVIKVGTVLPLQGGQRSFGEPVLRATQAFIDETNARGGVNGARLELVAYNACLVCQDEALQAVRRLVEEDQVFALVNTYVMVIAFQPVIPYLVERGVPLIQGGSESQTSDALSPINFATAPPGAFYAKFLPAMVTRYAKAKRIGITYLDVPAEANGIDELRRHMEEAGVEVVAEEPVAAAEEAVTNMDAIVTRMRAAGAEAVVATNPVLVIYGRLASARQRWNAQWVGPAAWSRLVEDGCGATCDDLVLTDTAGLSYVDRQSPQMLEFVDTMRRRFPGGELTGHTLAAWVGMQLTVEGLLRAGPDRRAFLRALETMQNVDLGTTSPLTFNPDRHMGGTASVLLRLKGGRYVKVSEPLSFGEADL